MQQWYAPSDPAMKEAFYEIESMHRFARLDLADDAMPYESTILKFRHLLEHHALTGQMMNVINETLEDKGLLLQGGTMVDATITHAPPSNRNQVKTRDPEMHHTKKGNQCYFDMNIRVGADVHLSLAHTVSVPPANESDISQLPLLVCEGDRAVFEDKGYVTNKLKRLANKAGVLWRMSLRVRAAHPLTEANKRFQPQDLLDPLSGRARVACDQAPVRLHQGAQQGDREERRAGVLVDGTDQSLPGEASLDELMGEIRPLQPKTGARGRNGLGEQR
jgi:IS5 family transposase